MGNKATAYPQQAAQQGSVWCQTGWRPRTRTSLHPLHSHGGCTACPHLSPCGCWGDHHHGDVHDDDDDDDDDEIIDDNEYDDYEDNSLKIKEGILKLTCANI